jgi:GTPase SAR1 family protein
LKDWIDKIKEHSNNGVVILLVGNKKDLIDKKKISAEEGENYAKQNGLGYIETSALTGENIVVSYQLLVNCKRINYSIFYYLEIYNLQKRRLIIEKQA